MTVMTSSTLTVAVYGDLVIDSVQFVCPLILIHSVFAPASDPNGFFQPACGFVRFLIDNSGGVPIDDVIVGRDVLNWDAARIIDQESDKTTRWLKEAIWIRSRGKDTMNNDKGAYKLDRIYDQIIHKRQPSELMTSSQSSKVASH